MKKIKLRQTGETINSSNDSNTHDTIQFRLPQFSIDTNEKTKNNEEEENMEYSQPLMRVEEEKDSEMHSDPSSRKITKE